jgi:cyclopropane-fatty-acyl-phospholipid synthase
MKSTSTVLAAHSLPFGISKILSLLDRIAQGTLDLTTPQGLSIQIGHGNGPVADLQINHWSALKKIFRNGDIGLAECYRDGVIQTKDVTALLRFAIQNQSALDSAINGHPLFQSVYWLKHLLRTNTKSNSRKNISAHYDLGNNFYNLWLDTSMTYSSAYFAGDHTLDLTTAQENKYQRMLDLTGAQPGDRLLEIGCGWGGFAEYAARKGIYVHGVTLSTEQLSYARRRIDKAGLSYLVQLELRDYRDLNDRYDHIVSIEMLEAVGERYWKTYFDQLKCLLKPSGKATIQVITIRDDKFKQYRRRSDFIQQYIFPGGMLPSVEVLDLVTTESGLRINQLDRFGKDYAETLRRWRKSFEQQKNRIRGLNFDQEFIKLWRFYLCYCEAGFDENEIDVVHLQLANAEGSTK